jgi:hypothetical protein
MLADPKLHQRLVLTVLEALEARGLTPIREYELHQLIRRAQEGLQDEFAYADEPISYSFDLWAFLRFLEQGHYLDELIVVRDGWVPRFEYQLTLLGRAQSAEDRERLECLEPKLVGRVDRVVDEFAASYRTPAPIAPR